MKRVAIVLAALAGGALNAQAAPATSASASAASSAAKPPASGSAAKPVTSTLASAMASVSASASAMASAATSGSALPSGHHEPGEDEELPPGHPDLPQGHPDVPQEEDQGGVQMPKIPQDSANPDASVPVGGIVATIRDENDKPVANLPVVLAIVRSSVPEGEARSTQMATTDADGTVRFTELKKGSGWSYRVNVSAAAPEDPSATATYGSEPFNLPLDRGFRVVVHRFPVTTQFDKLLAAVEGADTILELRDDVIEVQQMFEVINADKATWALGKGLTLALPKGFKGLRSADAMEDHQVTPIEGVGAKWTGSFPPGRSRVAYEFKIPYDGEASFDADIELPPRVLAARVRIPTRRGMTMNVDGFPPSRIEASGNGVKVLSTLRQSTSPKDDIRILHVHVGGIPTEGPERWIATAAGLAAAAAGIVLARRKPPPSDRKATARVRARKRQEILDEIVALERAHKAGEVGPNAFARERAKLVDQLADALEPEADEPRAGSEATAR